MKDFYVQVLGVRGSISTPDVNKMKYGGHTICFFIKAGDEEIVIDCGSGLMSLSDDVLKSDKKLHLFQSHMHLDHIAGTMFAKLFFIPNKKINFYGEVRNNKNIKDQLTEVFSPPVFPVSPDIFTSDVSYITFKENETFSISENLQVFTMHSNHPNLCTLYKIKYFDKTLCICVDYEHTDYENKPLLDFMANSNLIIYDSYFDDANENIPYPLQYKKDWGHSTWKFGYDLLKKSKSKQLLLVHHNTDATDDYLDNRQSEIENIVGNDFEVITAKEGEVYLL